LRIEETNLGNYLTDYYTGIREMNVLVGVENKIFDRLKDDMLNALGDQFIKTCSVKVLAAWEKLFDIVHDASFETEEFRRERLINRLSNRKPFTLRFLIERLESILGAGTFEVTVDHNNYTLYIESAVDNRMHYNEVIQTVHRIKPANMVYITVPVLHSQVDIGTQAFIAEMIFTRLGSWRLGMPFQERGANREVNLL